MTRSAWGGGAVQARAHATIEQAEELRCWQSMPLKAAQYFVIENDAFNR